MLLRVGIKNSYNLCNFLKIHFARTIINLNRKSHEITKRNVINKFKYDKIIFFQDKDFIKYLFWKKFKNLIIIADFTHKINTRIYKLF